MSTPRWQSWPIPACKPERGSRTPTFKRAALGAHHRRGGEHGGGRGGAGEHTTAVGQHASAGHGVLLRDFCEILRGSPTCGNAGQV